MRMIVLLAALLASTSAFAVDLTKPLLDQKGQPIHETADKSSGVVTLGEVIMIALATPEANAKDPIRAAKRGRLSILVGGATSMDFSADQVGMIKAGMDGFPPVWSARVLEAIDPEALK